MSRADLRRGGSVYWDPSRQRYRAEATVDYDARGKRVTRKGSGLTQAAALRDLRVKVNAYEAGLLPDSQRVTVWQVVVDWLDHGQTSEQSTQVKCRSLAVTHIEPYIGGGRLRRLTARMVDDWLADRAEHLTTSSLSQLTSILRRSIRRAVKRQLADSNVAELCSVPKGKKPGRPSKSLNLAQADALLRKTRGDSFYAYIVVSLLTGLRTEEVRALGWDHVHLDGFPDAEPPQPPQVWVWRSDRVGGDTKTRKSRRSLALPKLVVTELRKHKAHQAKQRLKAGEKWRDTGYVFTSGVGTLLDAANVRRSFRQVLGMVPELDPDAWTPRELRHSFVSLLSHHGVTVEEIARLVGHAGGSKVTELIYRHELRPVLEEGARVMDDIFSAEQAN